MRIVIHPGFHKTGTTTLQRAAQAQLDVLEDRLRLVLPHDIEEVNFAARRLSIGVTPKRVASFRTAVRGFAARIAPEDPRPLLISSEHLCGLMPGRKSVLSYAAAPMLLDMVAEALGERLPGIPLAIWFTTRAPETWLRSLYWQTLRSARLTEDLATFSRRLGPAADLEATVAEVRERLQGRAEVGATRLEDMTTAPLGPLGAAMRRVGVSTEGLAGSAAQNVQPVEAAEHLLALNRSDLDDAALARAKTAYLQDLRKAGRTRSD